MNTSKTIARLMGPLLLVMGLGMLAEPDTLRGLSTEFLSNLSLIYLAGMLTLVAGLAIVNFHNLWVADWRVIITVLGWLSVIGGVVRLLLPGQVRAMGESVIASPAAMIIGGIVTLVIGAVLSWCAYQDLWEAPRAHEPEPTAKPARARTARKAAARKASPRKSAPPKTARKKRRIAKRARKAPARRRRR